MNFKLKTLALMAMACGAATLGAQDISNYTSFTVGGKTVQVHGFVSEGFAYSNDNNYLTMDTSKGSSFTDGGVNVSTQLTDKFRVGVQIYDRDIGQLGKWHPTLDWAYADYRFASWFGVRGGKIKTALGLYNDTQDAEAVHTFALLPQSIYPIDLRSAMIAHTGGDVYGQISLRKAGSLDYTGYIGERTFDKYGGVYYFCATQNIPIASDSGWTGGGDLHWNTPLNGLMVGGSVATLTENRKGTWTIPVPSLDGQHYLQTDNPNEVFAGYVDYARGRWHFNGEFRRENNNQDVSGLGAAAFIGKFVHPNGTTGEFVSVAYRVSKRLELGAYNSRFYVNNPENPTDPNTHFIFDQTVTARFDITRAWNVKVEEHFIDGYGDIYSAHGFYSPQNLAGLKPKTDMLVVRTGWNF
jgi:hypothetical protein